jgi:glycine/D-amino acid oxidase-like deaminating enzyme
MKYLPIQPNGLPRYAPVVVAGGGIMGLSTAYWLAREGVEVLLVERQTTAAGASGKNAGIIAYGPLDEYLITARRSGRLAARELTNISIENRKLVAEVLARESIDAEYKTCGFLSLATSDDELRVLEESSRLLRADGFESLLLDREGCESMLGMKIGARFLAGVWNSRDGSLNPRSYMEGLENAARREGVLIAANTDLINFRREHSYWHAETSAGIVTTPDLVLATNEGTPRLLPALRQIFRTIVNQVIFTTPAAFQIDPSWAANSASEYGRQVRGGNLIVGGFQPFKGSQIEASEMSADLRQADLLLNRYLSQSFPELTHLRAMGTWSGSMALPGDGLPIIGAWPASPGLWLITGFGGQGLPFSQAMPARLAQAIAGGCTDSLPVSCDPRRLSIR